MRARRLAVASALVAASVLAPSVARGFCRTTTCTADCATDGEGCATSGLPLAWSTSCVGFSIARRLTQNLPEAAVRAAIRESFYAWTDLPCASGPASLTFAEQGDTSCASSAFREEGPNVNVVAFRDDDWSYHGIDGTLAKTTVSFHAATGEILDADIEVNAAFNELSVGDVTVAYDLRSILTHEIGHMIGLAHSSDPTATMTASYEPGTIELRSLAADDVAAACAAYPPERAARCDPTPHGGLATTCEAPQIDASCATTPGRARAGGSAVVVAIAGAIARRRGRR